MSAYADDQATAFDRSRARFEAIVAGLSATDADGLSHAELEQRLQQQGRQLLRQLLQDYLDLRAAREQRRHDVVGADTVPRTRVETGHQRMLLTVFGPVTVTRLAYRAPWVTNLHPADATMRLPAGKHSYGLRRLIAQHAAQNSFATAIATITHTTGVSLAKRQAEQLTIAAALDAEAFYATQQRTPTTPDQLLIMQFDGKGVVMIPTALRPETAKAAQHTPPTPPPRLSPGPRPARKRMAELAAVYDATPTPRTPTDVLNPNPGQSRRPGPTATNTWLNASLTHDIAHVINTGFDEADRRDPHHQRTWVALVDGNRAQINAITSQAHHRHQQVHIILDFVHVLEYLWKAAASLHSTTDPATHNWVTQHATQVLTGHSSQVAATLRGASSEADTCATYLTNNQPYLNYHHALSAGWPIATGVIEGACRHLVKDRMDITGARWGLPTAEAILQLRALTINNDFDAYWSFHQQQEHHRNHQLWYQQPTPTPTLTHAA